jgi:hypothetical protein
MASHENTAQARRSRYGIHRLPVPDSESLAISKCPQAAAGEYATTVVRKVSGDHKFSRLTCARVPCARNGGKIEAEFHSRRLSRIAAHAGIVSPPAH